MPLRNSTRSVLLAIGGSAILAAAVVQAAINVPHLREDMLEMGMRATLLRAILLVLYFSVVAMFAFAALVLNAAASVGRGRMPPLLPLWLIAGTYVIFGVVAYARVDASAHFLGYAAMGLIVGIGAAPTRIRLKADITPF
jgi:hypothetical protein